MKQRHAMFAVTLAAAVAVTGAEAEAAVVIVPDVAVSIDSPEGWEIQRGSDLVLVTPDTAMSIRIAADDSATDDDAWLRLDSFIRSSFDDLQSAGDREVHVVNGLTLEMTHAKASDDEASIIAGLLTTPSGERAVVIVVGVWPDAQAYEAEMQAALGSLAVYEELQPLPLGPFDAMVPAAAYVADQLTAAIDADDYKALLDLMPSKLDVDGKTVKKSKLKKVLKKWARQGGLDAYFNLGWGNWKVLEITAGFYIVYRDDGVSKHHGYFELAQQANGRWMVTGTGAFTELG